MKGEDAARRGYVGGFNVMAAGAEQAVARVVRVLSEEAAAHSPPRSKKAVRKNIAAYVTASTPRILAMLLDLPDEALRAYFRSEIAPYGVELKVAGRPDSDDVARLRADLATRTGPIADARHRLECAVAVERCP